MTERSQKLLLEALDLSIKERAELAVELIASVDGGTDADVEAAWAAEIEARARRALAGESKGHDWRAVCEEIEGRLRKK
jgi:putative addiction module component (TIGR02574 family)